MSNYYNYREVKVMIAHRLMALDGWKVYGYKQDESDLMTDYYSPASWCGVAEKNGYILCVDVYGSSEPQKIEKCKYSSIALSSDTMEKIRKLQQMTVERGASQSEEDTAKNMIAKLQNKKEENITYEVVEVIPGHMAHPARCNWHIEKDGIIIAKGNGILKFSNIYYYYAFGNERLEDLEEWKKNREKWINELTQYHMDRGYYSTEEEARNAAESASEGKEKDFKLIKSFNDFINKIDTTCGGLIGEGDGITYEKVTKTEYKKELKPVEIKNGEIKEGQLFILKANFSQNCYKGLVYRIHGNEYNGEKFYNSYKLNKKYTKECMGRASSSNRFYVQDKERFLSWIEKGYISWCKLEEVKTPYTVEKVIKKKRKTERSSKESVRTENNSVNADLGTILDIKEDVDTRNGNKIYVAKIKESLSRDEYVNLNKKVRSYGGYYSKFKHGFIFTEEPCFS